MQKLIAKRLKTAREASGLTQQELSDQLGFKDRQTLAAIEAGVRKVSADEFLNIMKILGRDVHYFTDPLRLVGEGDFTWHASDEKGIEELESRSGTWVAAYRAFVNDTPPRIAPLSLNLTPRSPREDVMYAAEWLANEWQLGDVPSARLEETIRTRLKALVLRMDEERVHSGACRTADYGAIFVKQNIMPHFAICELAVQLFHLLTWTTIEPEHVELPRYGAEKRKPERMCAPFARALLVPERRVREALAAKERMVGEAWPRTDEGASRTLSRDWFHARAKELNVPTTAYYWRLVDLKLFKPDLVSRHIPDWSFIDDRPILRQGQSLFNEDSDESLGDAMTPLAGLAQLRGPRHLAAADAHATSSKKQAAVMTPLFSDDFVRTIHAALVDKKIDHDLATKILGLNQQEMEALFTWYRLKVPS